MRLRALPPTLLALCAVGVPVLHAQTARGGAPTGAHTEAASTTSSTRGLRGRITDLFIFGPGSDPLFLSGSADQNNPATIQVHGTHFGPASAAENATIIGFLGDAIGGSVSNLPIGSTSGAETFRFEGGVPVRTSTSAGPIFAERAATLGRGRAVVGINQSGFHFNALRGVNLHDVGLTFTHENVTGAACDADVGQSCAPFGVPAHENDIIQVRLSLDIDVKVSSFYLTYGVTDRLDLGVVMPVVSTSLRGQSNAQIQPFGGGPAQHFFSGTPQSPVLDATRNTQGSATGLGDVSMRAKARLVQTPRTSVALLADARFPTGGADDLLGTGRFSARGLAVLTSRVGTVSPHANVGYLYRGDDRQNDAVLGTVGFDQLLGRTVTLAADLITELQVGASKLQLPEPVTFTAPFRRTVQPTQIPDMRDDIVNGSFGVKIVPSRNVTLLLNSLFPLNRGGLRPGVTYTAGLELGF